jgi:hypothetical protein
LQCLQAVHAWDIKLLPVVEQLTAQGHRPPVFKQVWVQRQQSDAPKLKQRLDPAKADTTLELTGCNRWGSCCL